MDANVVTVLRDQNNRVSCSQNFCTEIIQRRLSGTKIVKIVTTAAGFANPEIDSSICKYLFVTLCLKPLCKFVSRDSFVREKSDDYSLIVVYPK
jgi:hypothetical protein